MNYADSPQLINNKILIYTNTYIFIIIKIPYKYIDYLFYNYVL